MQAVRRLWNAYQNSGSRHFSGATDLKRNRVLNMLFSMSFMGGIYIALIELAFAAVLLPRDYDRYIVYLPPFAIATLIYPLMVAVTVVIKNLTGSFQVTFLNNIFVNLFCFALARFLGEKANMHLIILSQFPIIFLFYRYGSWWSIFGHIALAVLGVTATLISYRVAAPLYPLPDDLADLPGYLCWIATFSMLVWYSVYNWREVHMTEKLLEDERDQTRELLNETIPILERTEAKYRHLVDDSSDLIFQLNADCRILSMNKTSQRLLSFLPDDMVGKNMLSYLTSEEGDEPGVNVQLFAKNVNEVLQGHRPNRFRARFRHKHRSDGVELHVILQLAKFQGATEIMGHATEVEPEVTLQFLDQEKGRYTLTNNILHADILAQRIADRISIHFTLQELNAVRTCFREIVINAIEHGNLGVTFEEKTQVIENGDFMEFLLERQRDERFAARRVRVVYFVSKTTLILRVSDEGEGFDHRSFLNRAQNDDSLLYLEHGRGITMARNAFDSVEFNEKGNQVTLKKNLSGADKKII
jgi:PAS domain S-box-containing protein